LPGNAEAQVIWAGTVKCLLILYFIGRICAKDIKNPLTCVKVIANQRWDVFFETQCIKHTIAVCEQVEEKEKELTECQQKMSRLREERDALMKQSNSAKRYLEGLPTTDEHAANLRQVNTSPAGGLTCVWRAWAKPLTGLPYLLDGHGTGYAGRHIWCLSQARIEWEDCSRKGIRRKKMVGDGGGSLISPDGVAPSRMVGVSASVIFPCTTKSRRSFLLLPAHRAGPGKCVLDGLPGWQACSKRSVLFFFCTWIRNSMAVLSSCIPDKIVDLSLSLHCWQRISSVSPTLLTAWLFCLPPCSPNKVVVLSPTLYSWQFISSVSVPALTAWRWCR